MCVSERFLMLYKFKHAFISSRLNYCNSLILKLSKSPINVPTYCSQASCQVLSKVGCNTDSSHWLPVKLRVQFKVPFQSSLRSDVSLYS